MSQGFAKDHAAPRLIVQLCAGAPSLEATRALLEGLVPLGLEAIVLSLPFSDPVADGPYLEAANLEALEGEVDVARVLSLVAGLEGLPPLYALSYANPVFAYGIARFARDAAKAGFAGLILPDVPLEEREAFAAPCEAAGLQLLPLVAPAPAKRLGAIAAAGASQPFLYALPSVEAMQSPARWFEEARALEAQVNRPLALVSDAIEPERLAEQAGAVERLVLRSALSARLADSNGDVEEAIAWLGRCSRRCARPSPHNERRRVPTDGRQTCARTRGPARRGRYPGRPLPRPLARCAGRRTAHELRGGHR